MDGPEIICRTLSAARVQDSFGNRWQYLSRSDHHSKVCCWAILFDLLNESRVLRAHANDGLVTLGLNHTMREFRTNRKKRLYFVIATRGSRDSSRPVLFAGLAERYGIVLSPAQAATLNAHSAAVSGPVGTVRMALEAKACMTAQIKAIPRLFDELQSSHSTVHGSADDAIAIGFAVINTAGEFLSADRNKHSGALESPTWSRNPPHEARRVVDKLQELPRRTRPGEEGFDVFGMMAIDMRNDGTPVAPGNGHAAFTPGSLLSYDQMIRRAASLYESRFR